MIVKVYTNMSEAFLNNLQHTDAKAELDEGCRNLLNSSVIARKSIIFIVICQQSLFFQNLPGIPI